MPKVIENLRSRLIEEAEKQIAESGYSAMTIRSVAKACGVGVGTVYNYFSSKDSLLATYMLEDWSECISTIHATAAISTIPKPVVRCIHEQLQKYAKRHSAIFQDDTATAIFAGAFSRYHPMLRSQLAETLRKFCDSDFTADFIAEALLTWTMAGTNLDEIYGTIQKLF